MLIHATITVTGDKEALAACEARLRRLLSSEFLKEEVTEHHGRDVLCYDLKVAGGIPFPTFAQASQEFPGLEFGAEWVNVEAGERGHATLVNGRVTGQASERVATRAGDEHPVHVEVAPGGTLTLGLAFLRTRRDEWRGYAVTATRDALFRVVRSPDSGLVELYVTEGGPEWALAWRGRHPWAALEREVLMPPVAIENADFRELETIARSFAADWMWFASAKRTESAVERSRYAGYGYPVSAANVRASKLHRMRADAAGNGPLVHSTLAQEDAWVKDLLLATWAVEV
jgi:hypothetical protein